MRYFAMCLLILIAQNSLAASKSECLAGNFAACKVIFNHYGSTSDKTGATEFFASACGSQNLKISCQVTSTEKSQTLKKALELENPDGALFVIDGPKVEKIYQVSAAK